MSAARDDLARRLTTTDAVVIGLGAMVGAGVFAAPGPAAAAAGSWMLVGLALAALVAYANATSSAQLAAIYPESGATGDRFGDLVRDDRIVMAARRLERTT